MGSLIRTDSLVVYISGLRHFKDYLHPLLFSWWHLHQNHFFLLLPSTLVSLVTESEHPVPLFKPKWDSHYSYIQNYFPYYTKLTTKFFYSPVKISLFWIPQFNLWHSGQFSDNVIIFTESRPPPPSLFTNLTPIYTFLLTILNDYITYTR